MAAANRPSKNYSGENASDPTPLLIDKAASLPSDSKKRKHYENFENTLNNSSANVGSGFDNLTRESYKDTKRIIKSSEFLQKGIREPLPSSGSIAGEEEGKPVSNLQSWKPAITNAVKPISDATGSHADTASSVVKSPMGTAQFMPTSVVARMDSVSPQFTNEMDATFKSVQMDSLMNLPSKSAGSVRNLATASDPKLSVPYEIAPDVYNGLMEFMDEISNFIDSVMTSITNFAISALGGLVDSLFPADQLSLILESANKLAGNIEELNQMLGGFLAISQITNILGGIASLFSSALSNPAQLALALASGANVAEIFGIDNSLGCAGSQLGLEYIPTGRTINTDAGILEGVLSGGVGNLNGGLGNLGGILGGGFSGSIGNKTINIRNPEQLLAGILPPELNQQIDNLDQMSGLGLVGNLGYSIGKIMDDLSDIAFSMSMNKHATHSSILGPNFNKQTENKEAYAQEPNPGFFQESRFVKGAQGNKGVTMMGPGSTSSQKVFGQL